MLLYHISIIINQLLSFFTYNKLGGYMSKKEEFKEFVKDNPKLLKYVRDGSMTFQKFYEMYDIYGKDDKVWNEYLKDATVATATSTAGAGIGELFKMFKNIDFDSVQRGIGNLERVLGVVGEMGKKDASNTPKNDYKPRPIYKHFED